MRGQLLGLRGHPHAPFALALVERGLVVVMLGRWWAWPDGVLLPGHLGQTLDACERAGLVKVDDVVVVLTESGRMHVGDPPWQRGTVFGR